MGIQGWYSLDQQRYFIISCSNREYTKCNQQLITFVPKCNCPMGRTETFTSQRRDPSCIFPLLTPKYRTNLCNSAAYSAASIPVLISGSETISSKGTPALFKSTCIIKIVEKYKHNKQSQNIHSYWNHNRILVLLEEETWVFGCPKKKIDQCFSNFKIEQKTKYPMNFLNICKFD